MSLDKEPNFLILLLCFASLALTVFSVLEPIPKNLSPDSVNLPEIVTNDIALKKSLKVFGPKQTLATLYTLSTQQSFDCHQRAHQAGRLAAQIFPIEKAFREGSGECHSGYYHGTTEEYFAKYGTANLAQNLSELCTESLNGFFRHQCYHGVGHGLMGWTSYEINEALAGCDMLTESIDKNSCATGVFMENYTGAFATESEALKNPQNAGHVSKYLSDDPQFPCNFVTSYQDQCYFLQTSRMIQVLGPDFEKIAAECEKAPEEYQDSCFSSMGRDVGGSSRPSPVKAVEKCAYAPDGTFETACLMGAVQDYFWDPSGADSAVNFCRLLTDEAQKSSCYNVVIGRGAEILISKNQKVEFCQKVEQNYLRDCQDLFQI